MLVVIVEALLIPITFPLRGEQNTIQSLLSSAMFTRVVILEIEDASSAPEGPVRIKSTVCDSGSSTNSYAVVRSVLPTEYVLPDRL